MHRALPQLTVCVQTCLPCSLASQVRTTALLALCLKEFIVATIALRTRKPADPKTGLQFGKFIGKKHCFESTYRRESADSFLNFKCLELLARQAAGQPHNDELCAMCLISRKKGIWC